MDVSHTHPTLRQVAGRDIERENETGTKRRRKKRRGNVHRIKPLIVARIYIHYI
jgi:hypothetical protein